MPEKKSVSLGTSVRKSSEEKITISKELKEMSGQGEQKEKPESEKSEHLESGKPERKRKEYQLDGAHRNPNRKLTNDDCAKIIDLSARGVGKNEIAKLVAVHPRTISRTLQKFERVFAEIKNIEDFSTVRQELITAGELAALKSVVKPGELEAARMNDRVKAFEVFHKAGRLERGQSTANIETKTFTRIELDR
jgi:hypothetical protein